MNKPVIETAKIVGVADANNWSQVHIFTPLEKEKQLAFGAVLAAFSLESQDGKAVDLGKELIQRFHELYYASQEKKPLKRLKLALKELKKEMAANFEADVGAGIIIHNQGQAVFYGGQINKTRVVLKRGGVLVDLIEENGLVSGFLMESDLLLIGTKQFFELVSASKLELALEADSPREVVEILAPLIQGEKQNGRAAAVVVKLILTAEETAKLKAEPKKQPALPWRERFKEATDIVKENLSRFKRETRKEPEIYLKGKKIGRKKKKLGLSVALVLIFLLGMSVTLGMKKQKTNNLYLKIGQVFEEVDYRLDEGKSLTELNPLRAKLLFEEAKTLLEEKKASFTPDSEEYQQLVFKIEEVTILLAEVSHCYQVEADVWLDLGLAKQGFKGEDWDRGGKGLVIWDAKNQTLLMVNTGNKSAEILAGGEELAKVNLIAGSKEWAYLAGENKVFGVNINRKTTQELKSEADWGQAAAAVGFSNNFYLLDSQKNQVWKYVFTGRDLNEPVGYLKDEEVDLNQAVDLAIDGSVWLLDKNGRIRKFTQGKRDAFSLVGLVDPLVEPIELHTNEELESLYILDPKTTRIVLTDKQGEFKAEYIWPGLAGAKAIFANEEQGWILVLTGEKIFKIELKT